MKPAQIFFKILLHTRSLEIQNLGFLGSHEIFFFKGQLWDFSLECSMGCDILEFCKGHFYNFMRNG